MIYATNPQCLQKHETQPKNPTSPPKHKEKSQSLWPMLCVQKDIQTLKMELFMLFLYIFAEAEIEGQKGFDNGVQNTSVHSSSP